MGKEQAIKILESGSKSGLEEAVRFLLKESPVDIIDNLKAIERETYYSEVKEQAFRNAAENYPKHVIYNLKAIESEKYYSEVKEHAYRSAAEKDPYAVIHSLKDIESEKYYSEVKEQAFRNAAENYPKHVIYSLKAIERETYYSEVKEQAFRNAAENYPRDVIINLKDIEIEKYYSEIKEHTYRSAAEKAPEVVIDDLDKLKYEPYEAELKEKAFRNILEKAPEVVFDNLEKMEGESYKLDVIKKTIDFSSLEVVQKFNELHDEPNNVRFDLLKYTNASQDYNLITKGRAEAFTSTYNGILNDMITKMQTSNQKITDIISPEQMQNMGIFLEAASSYGRMSDVLKFIPKEKLPEIINDLSNKIIENKNDLKYASTFMSIITNLDGNLELRKLLESEIKNQYLNAHSQTDKDKFGLIAAAYANNSNEITKENKAFFIGLAHNTRYEQPAMLEIGKKSLVDSKGSCNQLMVFAADADSIRSFEHWKEEYKNKPGWKIEEKDNYVHISSTGGKVPVHIYANKPDKHDEGLKDINAEVALKQGTAEAKFQMFIGRGHSYNAKDYLPLITSDMKLIHLGSCGGYGNLTTALEKSPEAQVISTKATGSMYVNDPLLLKINESINLTGSIIWAEQQKFMEEKIKSNNVGGYILPHKNIDLAMQQKYNEISNPKDDNKQNSTEPQNSNIINRGGRNR